MTTEPCTLVDPYGAVMPCDVIEPCTAGTTLYFAQPCGPENPPMGEWCDTYPDHPVCVAFVGPEITDPPMVTAVLGLPATGDSNGQVQVGGLVMLVCGAILSIVAWRRNPA